MSAEVVVVMTTTEAEWVTNRIRNAVSSIRVGFDELESAVIAAKNGSAHVALGYPSWTAYLSDTLGREPLRLDATERRELVAYLSGEGMSTRAIAPIVGVAHKTVARDLAPVSDDTPVVVDRETGEITQTTGAAPTRAGSEDTAPVPVAVEEGAGLTPASDAGVTPAVSSTVTGLDGKTYTRPAAPRLPRPRADIPRDVTRALVQIDTGRRALEALTPAQLRTQDEEARSRWAANLSDQMDALAGVLARLT